MKELIKNRWFVFLLGILIAAVVLLGIGVILYCNGYRITYPQQFETSWDAVSSFAAWTGILVSIASAVASFMAVWYAIRVADKQNQIALFEKRYECFQFFEECFVLYKNLNSGASDELINALCCHMLGVENLNEVNKYNFQNKIKQFEYLIHQMAFLFPDIKEADTAELYKALTSYLAAILDKKGIEKKKQEYVETIKKWKKYLDAIWDCMMISGIK